LILEPEPQIFPVQLPENQSGPTAQEQDGTQIRYIRAWKRACQCDEGRGIFCIRPYISRMKELADKTLKEIEYIQ